jgi:hypothetical protein
VRRFARFAQERACEQSGTVPQSHHRHDWRREEGSRKSDDGRPAAQPIPEENGGRRRFVFAGTRERSTGKQKPKFTKDVPVLRADYAARGKNLFGVREIIRGRLSQISNCQRRAGSLGELLPLKKIAKSTSIVLG